MIDPGWRRLAPPTPALAEVWLRLHHALQPAAAVALACVPPEPDASHATFAWSTGLDALVGRATPVGLRAGLRFADLSAIVVDDRDRVDRELALAGRTLEDAYAWFTAIWIEAGALPPGAVLSRPSYDLPEDATTAGPAFIDDPLHEEVAGWYANAQRILQGVADRHEGASPVRCWPHHFDIATLITLDQDGDAEGARSVGVGLAPGDARCPEPYWYVTPWPYPSSRTLPKLEGGGDWATDGWVGAVLPARAFTDVDGAARGGGRPQETSAEQEERVAAFLASAVRASMNVLRSP